jgi:short-subunit dehydrogenase
VRDLFETNTFGVMAMTQAVLPRFRARKSGVVLNVTSSVTLTPMPLVSVYTASKMAIEGFTGSLAHELGGNARVKLVEPGYGPTTRFSQNTGTRIEGFIPGAYARFAQMTLAAFAQPAAVTTESDVAETVWRAANEESGQLRFPACPDAVALAHKKLSRGGGRLGRRTRYRHHKKGPEPVRGLWLVRPAWAHSYG